MRLKGRKKSEKSEGRRESHGPCCPFLPVFSALYRPLRPPLRPHRAAARWPTRSFGTPADRYPARLVCPAHCVRGRCRVSVRRGGVGGWRPQSRRRHRRAGEAGDSVAQQPGPRGQLAAQPDYGPASGRLETESDLPGRAPPGRDRSPKQPHRRGRGHHLQYRRAPAPGDARGPGARLEHQPAGARSPGHRIAPARQFAVSWCGRFQWTLLPRPAPPGRLPGERRDRSERRSPAGPSGGIRLEPGAPGTFRRRRAVGVRARHDASADSDRDRGRQHEGDAHLLPEARPAPAVQHPGRATAPPAGLDAGGGVLDPAATPRRQPPRPKDADRLRRSGRFGSEARHPSPRPADPAAGTRQDRQHQAIAATPQRSPGPAGPEAVEARLPPRRRAARRAQREWCGRHGGGGAGRSRSRYRPGQARAPGARGRTPADSVRRARPDSTPAKPRPPAPAPRKPQ